MFEIGQEYMLVFGSEDEADYKYGVIRGYEHPLIKFVENAMGKESIYNVANSSFFRAEKR
jgi:hypothetical protein